MISLVAGRMGIGREIVIGDWILEGRRWRNRSNGEHFKAMAGGYGGETVALIMIAVTVAAAAASAYATYSASQAQEQAYKYNAKEAERQAEIAAQQSKFAAQQQAERDKRTRAAARAIQGTSGVEVGEGSSLLVDLDSAKQAELNYQAIRYQGEAQVRALQSQATLDRFQGRTAAQQGLIGAGASLLGGAGSAYQGYKSSTPKSITVPYSDTASGVGPSYYGAGSGQYM